VILTRSSLDEKVITLRLAPGIATSIRMPEPVNSVVVGDPESFQAEHSEREPELITVKPATNQPAQTNLLITTTLGHQLNLLLVTVGEQNTGSQPVDVLLTYGKPKSGSFLVEESAFPTSLVAETARLGPETKALPATAVQSGPTVTQLVNLLKPASNKIPRAAQDASEQGLDRLLERQRRALLPALYGQRPGEIETGQRLKAGVSEVVDGGKAVIVLFCAFGAKRLPRSPGPGRYGFVAQDAMQRAIAIDAIADQELQAADFLIWVKMPWVAPTSPLACAIACTGQTTCCSNC
jgi:hypothetical protein